MDDNNKNNYSGDYSSPESYNPDAQYGFSTNASSQTNQQYGDQMNQSYNQQYSGQANQSYDQQYSGQTNQFYGQQYNGSYNYGNGNYNANPQGPAPLDKKGRPLRNRFGMKLTFSIIEMMFGLIFTISGSWCFGLIPLILAIIACVFTCLQNKDFKQGNWNGFIGKRNASTVLLWIGFAFYMVFIVLIIIVAIVAFVLGGSLASLGTDSFTDILEDYESVYEYVDEVDEDEDEDEDDRKDQDDEDDEDMDDQVFDSDDEASYSGNGDTKDGNTYNTRSGENLYIDDFNTFELNGHEISLPISVKDFCEAGFSMNEEDAESILEGDSDYGYSYYDENGEYMGTLFVYNVTNKDQKVAKGMVGGLTINNYTGVKLELVEGISFDSSADEALAVYGDPTDAYGEDGSAYLSWYMNDRYGSSLELDFWDGELQEVWVMNYLALEE